MSVSVTVERGYAGKLTAKAVEYVNAIEESVARLAKLVDDVLDLSGPPDQTGTFFGVYALSGVATAWLAPTLVNLGTRLTDTQQGGFAMLLLLLGGTLALKGRALADHGRSDRRGRTWPGARPRCSRRGAPRSA